jgi:plastocyanin
MRQIACVALVAFAACSRACAADLEVHVNRGNSTDPLPSVVYAIPVAGHFTPHAGATAVVDQINKQFAAQVSVVETGTAVIFPNKDNIRHHVYSFSSAKPFELKLYSGKPSNPVVFDRPGIVTLGCNIHDQMLGYIVVVDTSWHAVADVRGVVVLKGLPAGDYLVHAWSPGVHQGEHPVQKVHVGGEGAPLAAIEIPPVGPGAPG